jgi:hypothetical protein
VGLLVLFSVWIGCGEPPPPAPVAPEVELAVVVPAATLEGACAAAWSRHTASWIALHEGVGEAPPEVVDQATFVESCVGLRMSLHAAQCLDPMVRQQDPGCPPLPRGAARMVLKIGTPAGYSEPGRR